MIYALISASGVLGGFLDDRINTIPASGVVELTATQYTQWCAAQSALVWQSGALVAAPPPPAPSPAAIAAAAVAGLIAAGCQIVSAGTPALSGTYAIDAQSTANINAVSTYITVNGKFPAGQASLPWPDITGAPHVFGACGQFQAFASAIADWVMKISLFGMGQLPEAPTGTETIP